MTTDRLRKIAEREAREHLRDFWRVNLVECYGDTLTDVEIDEVLHMIRTEARVPAPPRIIRTADELADLDPDTMLVSPVEIQSAFTAEEPQEMAARGRKIGTGWLPAVVIATGDHVRAARQALEEA